MAKPTEAELLDLLSDVPPNQWRTLTEGVNESDSEDVVNWPEIVLWCKDDTCNRLMRFKPKQTITTVTRGVMNNRAITYVCRHCGKSIYWMSLLFRYRSENWDGMKLGQYPEYGDPIPTEAISLLGGQRDLFLNGYRLERLGYGVGAFAYYRRIVEDHKARLFNELVAAAKRLDVDAGHVRRLENAGKEVQFSRAVDMAKDCMPAQLLLRGNHNPLKLLHSALSEGLHAQTDADCLESARTMRLVLFNLADRIKSALKDQSELDSATSRLITPKPAPIPAPPAESPHQKPST